MSTTEVVVEVAVPIATASIAAVAVLVGTWNGARNDKKRWLREERRQAYVRLLDEISAAMVSLELPAARSATNAVSVLGPEPLANSANDCYLAMAYLVKKIKAQNSTGVQMEKDELRAMLDNLWQLEANFAAGARETLL